MSSFQDRRGRNEISRALQYRLDQQARTGILSFGAQSGGRSVTQSQFDNTIQRLVSQQDPVTITPQAKAQVDSQLGYKEPDMSGRMKHSIAVSSWDLQQQGSMTVQLPSTAVWRYAQVRELALRSDIKNISGAAASGQITVGGVTETVSVPAGSYSIPDLFVKVRESLNAVFTEDFNVTPNPITFFTQLTQIQTPVSSWSITAVPGNLFWVLGFRRNQSATPPSATLTSSHTADVSSLNSYALSCDEITPAQMQYANGAPANIAVLISSHAAGTICRGHAFPIIDSGIEKRTQSLTFRWTELLNKNEIQLEDLLFTLVLDLWL